MILLNHILIANYVSNYLYILSLISLNMTLVPVVPSREKMLMG